MNSLIAEILFLLKYLFILVLTWLDISSRIGKCEFSDP